MYDQPLSYLLALQGCALRKAKYQEISTPTFLPIRLTGGIGDVIMAIDTLRYLKNFYDLFVFTPHLEAFRYFCWDINAQEHVPDYDFHLELNAVARFKISDKFSGFLMKDHELLFRQQLALFKQEPALETMVKRHAELDAHLAIHGRTKGLNRRQFSLYSLGINQRLPDITPIRSKPLNYITIHDGYDTSNWSQITGRSTKQWKWEYWNQLVKNIKKKWPGLRLVQLGSKTGRRIRGVDECLLNKTTLTQAFDLLKHSRLHVDGDSGLVHAATRMGIPCVVMFGPTPDYFYGYPQNINLRAKTCDEACYWVRPDWMAQCPIGYKTPQCMDALHPDQVLESIEKALK